MIQLTSTFGNVIERELCPKWTTHRLRRSLEGAIDLKDGRHIDALRRAVMMRDEYPHASAIWLASLILSGCLALGGSLGRDCLASFSPVGGT